jgi:organic hydroperoxide reductase OsmC/OhrA
MHRYGAAVIWEDTDRNFSTGRYSRAHRWEFDGGITVEASSSPNVVRLPFSKEDAVDPEEAFVASVASCHMLTFLYIAHKAGFVILSYRDRAVGIMEKNDEGREWISKVELYPEIVFEGVGPSSEILSRLHDEAHHECYIANSIKSEVVVHVAGA